MLFNSYEFIFIFLPLTALIYSALRKHTDTEASLIWLIAASLFFYGWWNPAYIGLIIGSMLFNYAIGWLLNKESKKSLLIFGISMNLGLLAYYKYANFFMENISMLTDSNWNIELIILPLAISFFTFQQITYLVDTYRNETREYSFIHYALFVTFFPQLIAGPIVHHKEMIPQFMSKFNDSDKYRFIAIGISIFFLGLFKKVGIADSIAPHASGAFDSVAAGNALSFFEAWKGAFAYTFQLYFDFSGYSDMAIGIAALFGIRLPVNFNSPYQSYSIIEFWKRWHITLSRFLKDYVYIPLGGNRKGKIRRYINLFITMLLGGLWHGAGWTFVAWGAIHGIYLIINHAWRAFKLKIGIPDSNYWLTKVFSRSLTFISIVISWVFFRAEDFPSAILMLEGMLGYHGVIWPIDAKDQLGLFANLLSSAGIQFDYLIHFNFNGMPHIASIILMMIFVMKAPNVPQIMGHYEIALYSPSPGRLQWKPTIIWGLVVGVLAVIAILRLSKISEFLYFQF